MKQMLWITASAVAAGLGAAYALRALDSMWRRTTRQAPPEMPKWGKLVGLPLRIGVKSHYAPPTV